eukprot:TRINITY_DN11726_c0_g1_i4.p1 TRINITY_DN11726_c0_g1~~TRINITY_DN11726_c0_g1_i4.p1  ORF type:complete len:308 (-),score=69.19 TRINITY_DN11726_c0_g1_i4:109-993(-)
MGKLEGVRAAVNRSMLKKMKALQRQKVSYKEQQSEKQTKTEDDEIVLQKSQRLDSKLAQDIDQQLSDQELNDSYEEGDTEEEQMNREVQQNGHGVTGKRKRKQDIERLQQLIDQEQNQDDDIDESDMEEEDIEGEAEGEEESEGDDQMQTEDEQGNVIEDGGSADESDDEEQFGNDQFVNSHKQEEQDGDLDEDIDTNIQQVEHVTLPSGQKIQAVHGGPQDMIQLKKRMAETIQILQNFKELRDPKISRPEYLEQLQNDIMSYYDYNEFFSEVVLQLFPVAEAVEFIEACEVI